jgi:hypothetical protein
MVVDWRAKIKTKEICTDLFEFGKIKCKVEYVSSENEIKNLIILEMKNRSKLSYIFGGY